MSLKWDKLNQKSEDLQRLIKTTRRTFAIAEESDRDLMANAMSKAMKIIGEQFDELMWAEDSTFESPFNDNLFPGESVIDKQD